MIEAVIALDLIFDFCGWLTLTHFSYHSKIGHFTKL